MRLTSSHHIARLPGVKRGIGGLVLDAFTARMLSTLHGSSQSTMFPSADTWEPFVNARSLGRMLMDREVDMLRDVAADRAPFLSTVVGAAPWADNTAGRISFTSRAVPVAAVFPPHTPLTLIRTTAGSLPLRARFRKQWSCARRRSDG